MMAVNLSQALSKSLQRGFVARMKVEGCHAVDQQTHSVFAMVQSRD
jgi:hypothetical protein